MDIGLQFLTNGMRNVVWFRSQMKILYFDKTGYAIWSKRLEQGQFVIHDKGCIKRLLSFAELQCLLEGIEISNARHYKRFKLAG